MGWRKLVEKDFGSGNAVDSNLICIFNKDNYDYES